MNLAEAIERIEETERNLKKQELMQRRQPTNWYAYRMALREVAEFLREEVEC